MEWAAVLVMAMGAFLSGFLTWKAFRRRQNRKRQLREFRSYLTNMRAETMADLEMAMQMERSPKLSLVAQRQASLIAIGLRRHIERLDAELAKLAA